MSWMAGHHCVVWCISPDDLWSTVRWSGGFLWPSLTPLWVPPSRHFSLSHSPLFQLLPLSLVTQTFRRPAHAAVLQSANGICLTGVPEGYICLTMGGTWYVTAQQPMDTRTLSTPTQPPDPGIGWCSHDWGVNTSGKNGLPHAAKNTRIRYSFVRLACCAT